MVVLLTACLVVCVPLGLAVAIEPAMGFLIGGLLLALGVVWARGVFLHFIVLLAFAELILGGSGRYIELSDLLSFRKALFLFTWLLFVVLWIYDRRKPAFPLRSFRGSYYASLLAIFTFLFFGLGIGILRGNQLDFVFGDAQGFLFLTLSIPLCYFAWRAKIDVEFFLGAYLAATSIYALLKVLLHLGVQSGYFGVAFMADMLQQSTGQVVAIDLIGSQYRVASVGDVFLMFAFPILVGIASSAQRLRTKLAASAGTLFVLFALVVSGFRGLWLGAFLGLVVLVALAGSKHRLKIAAGILAGLLLASQIFAGTFRNVTSRIASTFEVFEGGEAFRVHQTKVLLRMAREHPVLGHGFGAIAPEVSGRTVRRESPYAFEVQTVALLMKMGIVGCLAWVVLFGWLLYTLLRTSWLLTNQLHAMVAKALCGGILAILFAAWTDPWLSSAVGMGTCAFIVVVADLLRRGIAPAPEVVKAAPRPAQSRIDSLARTSPTKMAPANR